MTVKVKNISGLEDYGTSIHRFAGKFEEASHDTMREFNTSLQGEKADAINAFFERLNSIQNSVFSQAPEAMRTYGQHIFTFTGDIKGLGFSSHAHTDDDAMNTLTESLRTSQRNMISIVQSDLVALFDEAIEAMGEGDSDLGDFDAQADSYISDEVSARKETHSGIMSAHSSLVSSVSGSSSTFASLTATTQNAKAVASFSPRELLDAIKRGDLSRETMGYLTAVYTNDDVEIIKVMISESTYKEKEKFFEDLANAKVKKAGLPVMMLIDRRLEKASDEGNVNYLDAFFSTLSNRDTKDLQLYSAKLSAGIDVIVDGINSQGQSLRKTLPKEYNKEQFEAFMQAEAEAGGRLKALKESSVRYGQINSILQYMHAEKFGKQYITAKNVSLGNGEVGDFTATIQRSFKKGSLKFENGEYVFGVQDMGIDRKSASQTKVVSSNDILDILKDLDKMGELRKQKENLWMETAYNTTKNIVSSNPIAGFFWDIMEAAATTKEEKELLTEVTKTGLNGLDEVELQKYNTLKTYAGNSAGGVIDHFGKAQEISEELSKLDKKILAKQFDVGGVAIKEGENSYKTVITDPRYDFEANLRMADLQQNGLRGYNFRQLLQKNNNNIEATLKDLKKADETIQAIGPSDPYTEEMKSLLTGESKQTIEDLGGEKIVKGLERFEEITKSNEDYMFNWTDYNTNENLYFNRLVGIETKIGEAR